MTDMGWLTEAQIYEGYRRCRRIARGLIKSKLADENFKIIFEPTGDDWWMRIEGYAGGSTLIMRPGQRHWKYF